VAGDSPRRILDLVVGGWVVAWKEGEWLIEFS
jgi:hypothetical protein